MLPDLGADAETDTGLCIGRQAYRKGVVLVKGQREGAQPRLKVEGVRIGGQVVGEGHALAVHKAQVLDIGWSIIIFTPWSPMGT